MRSKFGASLSMAMVVGVLLLVFLLGGCSASPSPATSGPSATETKPYGTLIVEGTAGSQLHDPASVGASSYRAEAAAFLDSLLWINQKGEYVPMIAERWEISADGLTHTFYIRKGVKFHNGDDLTGQDVKFSIERILAPAATYANAGIWRSAVGSVELKDNDYTVVLRLKEPQFELLTGFELLGGPVAVMPKKYIEEKGIDAWRQKPVGSGPWKVVSLVVSSRLELEANEDYWDKTRIAKFKNLTILNVPEQATRVAMLKTGELDIAEIGIDSIPPVKAGGLRVLPHDIGAAWGAILFYDMDNPQQYAFGDPRVRKALSLAVNRKEIGDKLYGGYAEPAALTGVRTGAFFYDTNVLKPDPYDPEGAKKLLADAGYASGFNTKSWSYDSSRRQFIEAVAGYWGKIGVKTDIVSIETSRYTTLFRPKLVPEIFNSVNITASSGPWQFEKMASLYHSTKGTYKNLKNPQLDQLIDKVPLTRDPAEKKKLALEAAVLAKNEYAVVAFDYVPEIWAVGSKVGDWTRIPGINSLGTAYNTIMHAK